ncbi:methionyl-tRNA formyltransferase [bacterium]|nr:methionyl-tRNA formyltransferase [bacterium]
MRPRLIFMGTPDFGVPTFRYLVENHYPVAAVVTRPDKPKGRGYQSSVSAVKAMALELGLPVLQPLDVNHREFLEQLKALQAKVIVVAAFGRILKTELLYLLPLGCINLHGSLLPNYRGAAPIQWAIAQGEKETGITVQIMAEEVDSGAILVQRAIPIGPDECCQEVYQKLAAVGGPATAEALEKLAEKGRAAGMAQDETQATLAPRLRREDGCLDWTQPAERIHNRVRAFNPWPGTYSFARGKRLKIITTQRAKRSLPKDTPPGSILEVDNATGWLVAAGHGTTLRVVRVQCDNAKEMAAQSFTCGYRVGVGSVLGLRRE